MSWIAEQLAQLADSSPQHLALLGVDGGAPLRYGELREVVREHRQRLLELGVQAGTRVGMSLSSGPPPASVESVEG